MSIEERRKDAEELAQLMATATRHYVKDVLSRAKAELDKEILNLEMKERLAAERKANAADPNKKRYLTELNEYAWDQSDKFVKLFVTVEGVQSTTDDAVTCNFTANSMQLLVNNLNGRDYGLTVNNLLEPIDVEKSYRKIKTDMIAIYMKKVKEGSTWDTLTTIQKRLKQKADDELKMGTDDNPEAALVNIMKKMYNSGDSKVKQMIAKTWTESQEKKMKGGDLASW